MLLSDTPAMDRQRRRLTLALLGAPLWLAIGTRAKPAQAQSFPVFDALLQHGKPNLHRQGLTPMAAVAAVWRPGVARDSVDEQGIVAALHQLAPDADTLYVDIENWPLLGVTDTVRSRHIDNYVRTAEIIRRAMPRVKFGIYGIAPLCVYWPIVRQDKQQLAEWRSANRDLQRLAVMVDYVLPSLYTFYDDPAGWDQFASASIEEARQYEKPIYPFLWYEYFDGNRLLRGREVDAHAWSDELSLCRAQADGIVLWGGSERNWSESASWWQAVLSLLRNGLNAPA